MIETKIKIKIDDRDELTDLLGKNFRFERTERYLEDDTLYAFADGRLKKKGSIFRLRVSIPTLENTEKISTSESIFIVTWKGPADTSSGFKEREELEFRTDAGYSLRNKLDAFEMKPIFRYQKYRKYYLKKDLKLTIDDTPMGAYLELLGNMDVITRSAELLGYKKGDFLTENYFILWDRYKKENGIDQEFMLFSANP